MANPAKLINIELSELKNSPESIFEDEAFQHWDGSVRSMLFWHGVLIEAIDIEYERKLTDVKLYDRFVTSAFPHAHNSLCRQIIRQQLLDEASQDPQRWQMDLHQPRSDSQPVNHSVTVVVCIDARKAPEWETLDVLLWSLNRQIHQTIQILVIEYGGRTAIVQDSVAAQAMNVEYFQVNDGLLMAQRLALEKAKGDVVGFVGDQTVVDPYWSGAIASLFDRNPNIEIVTGLTLPQSIESDRQAWHESMYGKAQGFERRWIQWDNSTKWTDLGMTQYGSDLNFAVRRSAKFDGSVWQMLLKELVQGQTIVYEPRAIVRVEVPKTDHEIEAKVYREVRSFYQYLNYISHEYPMLRSKLLVLGIWRFGRVLGAYIKGYGLPRSWFRSELRGISHEVLNLNTSAKHSVKPIVRSWPQIKTSLRAGQVETIDLSQSLQPIHTDAKLLRLYVKWCDRLLGFVEISSHNQTIGIDRIADALVDKLLIQILSIPFDGNASKAWSALEQNFNNYFTPANSPKVIAPIDRLPNSIPVTIIVPTCDRPDDLRNCLTHLHQIKTDRSIEIIIVDNRPQLDSAAIVVNDFPGVILIQEPRPGSSYARNAAFGASTGDIVVTIDDDVTVPNDWLEKLLVPFNRPEVMSVCGGVLPLVLDTSAQVMFEQIKGGLCFGYEKREVDRAWLDSFKNGIPPIWELGVSANSAFRAEIFSDPTIGLMEETLGAGMPSAGGEENHFAYKILRAGHTIVYDPGAYVYHRHRQTIKEFYKQLQGYMVSSPALLLTLWINEGDIRGRQHLLFEMPCYLWQCWRDRLLGKDKTPWPILFYELKGYLIGFNGYYKSQKIVQKQGRSTPYISPNDRQSKL